MCMLAWYGKAAQPHNMTFSQRKSWAESFIILNFDVISLILIFNLTESWR